MRGLPLSHVDRDVLRIQQRPFAPGCQQSHEPGYVRLSELANARGQMGLPVERDLYFTPDQPISAYAGDARRTGRVIT